MLRIVVGGVALLLAGIVTAAAPVERNQAADPLEAAWSGYIDSLNQAREALVGSGFFEGETVRAEAYRYLAGLVSLNNTRYLYFGDPAFPRFFPVVSPESDSSYSNPDTYYLAARISDQYAYRITGRLGTVNQTTIGTYAFTEKPDQDLSKTLAGPRATERSLKTDPNGHFELVISRQKMPAQNWLGMIEGATSITIYQIHGDWQKERKGQFHIERIGAEGLPPPAETELSVAGKLGEAGMRTRDMVNYWLDRARQRHRMPENSMGEPRIIQVASYGSYFAAGRYAVPAGKALIIEFPEPPGSSYWGWTLYNPWGQMLDFSNRQTSLNMAQAVPDADGKYRLVLAAEDPGTANWLDTAGHPSGALNWRVTSEKAPAVPVMRLVSLVDLQRSLPKGTAYLSAEERRARLALRQRAAAERFVD